MLLPLSDRQQLILETISEFIVDKNYPPTIPEIQQSLNLQNPGAVHKCLTALERKGYIKRIKGMHRGMDLTEEAKRKYLQ